MNGPLAGPKEFRARKQEFQTNMDFVAELCGSTLHFGPRSGENLFNAGFKQDVKLWKPRQPHQKAKVQTRKQRICAAFKAKGQIISEINFGVFKSSNKQTKIFVGYLSTSKMGGHQKNEGTLLY